MILNTYFDGKHFSIAGCAGYMKHSYGVISEHSAQNKYMYNRGPEPHRFFVRPLSLFYDER